MPRPEPAAWQFEAIGTAWQIDTAEPLAPDTAAAVTARIDEFDAVWSRFRPDSVVSRIAAEGGDVGLRRGLTRRCSTCTSTLHDVTDGAVTPLVGRTLSDLGYDEDYSLRAAAEPAAVPAWESFDWSYPTLDDARAAAARRRRGRQGPPRRPGRRGADRARRHRLHDRREWRPAAPPGRAVARRPGASGRRDPRDRRRRADARRALCASATNRRAWGDGLHHVLDGRTGRPTRRRRGDLGRRRLVPARRRAGHRPFPHRPRPTHVTLRPRVRTHAR